METLNLGIEGLDDIEQIGAGGSSRVYRAVQIELDRPVALKVLKASDDPEVARRFDRERKAMGRLSLNEGIVPVYSSGVTDRGEPYLIMPYYPNGSLQDRLAEGPVPWIEAVGYISSAAHTMAAAHAADVVHLDLKPANILLSSNGEPRIADFGIAKLMSDQTANANTGPSFTPTFTAPETLLGSPPSPASDVYGLAATLWALIAGRPPFRAIDGEDNTLMAVVGRVVHQPAGDLRQLAPDPICSVIEIAMAKEPTDRYPTAGAFGQALATAVEATRAQAANGAAGLAGAQTVAAGDAGAATTSMGAASPSSLNFDDAVPPRLVPATTPRSAGIADAVDRFSGIAVGLLVAGLLLVAVLLGRSLLTDGDDVASSTEDSQLVEAAGDTSSTVRNAQAGAGAGGDDDAAAGPTTSAATTTTTVQETTPVSSSPATATTVEETTTTEEETTTTVEETTTSEEETTTTEEETTTTEEETTTTETSVPTTLFPPLGRPPSVSANLRVDRAIINWTAPVIAEGLAGYTVFRNGIPLETVGPNVARYVDLDIPNLAPGTYLYQVRADGPASGDPASSGLSAPAEIEIVDPDPPDPDDEPTPADNTP